MLALRLKKLIAERNNQPQQKDLHDGSALQVQADSESNNTPGAIDFDPFEYHRIEVAGSDPTTVLIQVLMQQVGVICFSPRIARTHSDKELFSTLALMEGVDRKGLVRTIKTISVTPEQAREIVRMKKILRSAGQTITPRETEIELREQLLWHLYGLANMDVVDTTISLGDLRKAYEVYGSEFPGTVISNVASTAGCIISDEIGVQQKIDFSTMKKIHKPGMGTNSSPFCGKCRLARTTKGSYNTICPIIRPEAEQPR